MTGSISIQIDNLRDGDGDAIHFLWQRFSPQLKQLAKSKLKGLNDPAIDEDDIAQNAFASFCRGFESGRFERVEDRNDIWQVLLMLTIRKSIDERRRSGRAKRSLPIEVGENFQQIVREEVVEVASRALSPDFAVLLAEQFHHLLNLLPQSELKQIALMRFEGYNDSEIADELNVARRTVVRKLRLIRSLWLDYQPDGGARMEG